MVDMSRTPAKRTNRTRTQSQATGKVVRLAERDLIWMQKLHEHGPLSMSELHAFTAHTHKNLTYTRNRLTDLFNEPPIPFKQPVLIRPRQQNEALDARHRELIYDLSPSGATILQEQDLWHDYQPRPSGPWWHQRMVAQTMATIDQACRERPDLNLIFTHQILERAQAELRFKTKIHDSKARGEGTIRDLIPDSLFGFEYVDPSGSKTYRFFALEIDRATEPLTSSSAQRKSFERQVRMYENWINHGEYKGNPPIF